MRNTTRIFNEIEAGVWLTIAIGFLVYSLRVTGEKRRTGIICFVAFFIFGISDIIESKTGAWWRPLWLLAMKVPCVITFIYCYLKYRRAQRTTESKPPEKTSAAAMTPTSHPSHNSGSCSH